jgi:hypothetical protein
MVALLASLAVMVLLDLATRPAGDRHIPRGAMDTPVWALVHAHQ